MGTPEATKVCCSSSSRPRRRATATTRTPAAASRSQTAHPMPAEAPVTRATLPRQRSRAGSAAGTAAVEAAGAAGAAAEGLSPLEVSAAPAACSCGGTCRPRMDHLVRWPAQCFESVIRDLIT